MIGKTFQRVELAGRDLGFCLRSLARAPGFALAIVITLALGILASVAVFHLVAGYLFFPAPYRDPASLYTIGFQYRETAFSQYRSGLYLQAYENQTNVFSEFAAFEISLANVAADGMTEVVPVDEVTAGTFRTLGIQPALGRPFLPEEFQADHAGVVVVSHAFWKQYLGGSADAIGRVIRVDEKPCRVVGVLRPEQNLPRAAEVFRPLFYHPNPRQPFDPVLWIIGRLKPGVPPAAARQAAEQVKLTGIPQWAAAFFADQQTVLQPVAYFTGRLELWVLVVGTAFLFAIACLNAANLMLVRLVSRSRELSIRLAVGGSRAQVLRLLVLEPVILAGAAGAAVAAATVWALPAFFARLYGPQAAFQTYLDRPAWACIGVLTGAAALALLLASVMRLRRMDVLANLKSGGNAAGESRRTIRLRNALAAAQAALAIVLLGGTGLMVRTFEKVRQIDVGFDPQGRVIVQLLFPRGFELKPRQKLDYFQRLRARLQGLPGVRAVAYGQDSILSGFSGTAQLLLADGSYRPIAGNFVSGNYQAALGLRMRGGRWFSEDRHVSEVVINETLARMRFGDANPVGRTIRLQVSGNHDLFVAGVVDDVRDSVRASSGPRIYVPDWIYPPNISTLVLRLDRDPPPGFAAVVKRTISAFDPLVMTTTVRTVTAARDDSLQLERFIYSILRALSAIALGLAVIGLYSVMAYVARARTREFGVRLAVGATSAHLRRLVLVRSLRVAGAGILAGLAVSLGVTRFMKALLFQTTPYDPFVFALAAVLLVFAAIAAAWIPARRAASTDPVTSLRAE